MEVLTLSRVFSGKELDSVSVIAETSSPCQAVWTIWRILSAEVEKPSSVKRKSGQEGLSLVTRKVIAVEDHTLRSSRVVHCASVRL